MWALVVSVRSSLFVSFSFFTVFKDPTKLRVASRRGFCFYDEGSRLFFPLTFVLFEPFCLLLVCDFYRRRRNVGGSVLREREKKKRRKEE